MASVNRCTFIGNLGKDPEVRYTTGGQAVCSFSIACSESWTDKNSGQKNERTEWVRIQAWGKLAEICGEHLKKGKQVYVEGRLQTREYEKDGQKRYATEIVANEVKFLGSREGGREHGSGGYSGGNQQARQAVANVQQAFPGAEPTNDDIPF